MAVGNSSFYAVDSHEKGINVVMYSAYIDIAAISVLSRVIRPQVSSPKISRVGPAFKDNHS